MNTNTDGVSAMSAEFDTEPERQNWQQTIDSICEQSRLMEAIHEAHPGKENRALRDRLCTPNRAICVRLHYRRIALVRLSNTEAERQP